MNFNYSYRAFLITSLLFGILFLAFHSIKLSKYEEISEENYDVEYAEIDLSTFEEELPEIAAVEKVKIETNRAFNEAEKYIRDLENSREDPEETTEEKLEAMNKAIDAAAGFDNDAEIAKAKKKIQEAQEKLRNSKKSKKSTPSSGFNRKTTISYSLVDRTAILLPNPVYTCEGSGKVVISIEVDELGRVIKTDYNKGASTTSNECLIDSAIQYAKEARFTTVAGKPKQIGTISYNFPGQF